MRMVGTHFKLMSVTLLHIWGNLIPIDIPERLIFKPKPRTIIKDPRLIGYQNLDFNFAKEWERLYSDSYIT